MIGIAEIILAIISFSLIWFLIFRIKLKYNSKKPLKNIVEKIEKQENDYFGAKDNQDLKEKLGLRKKDQEIKKEEVEKKEIEKPTKKKVKEGIGEEGSILNYYSKLFKKMFIFYSELLKNIRKKKE